MELMMLFGNEVIDRIKVNSKKANTPNYIIDLEERLIARNEESLNFCSDAPHFALQTMTSKVSKRSNPDYA